MGEASRSTTGNLLEAIDELEHLVIEGSVQPVTHLSENAVLLWLRVLDGHDRIFPRLTESGMPPDTFYLGMQRHIANRIDPVPPSGDLAGYRIEFQNRLQVLEEKISTYLSHSGYRNSSDGCDQLMVEMNRVSRFLSTCLLDGTSAATALPDSATSKGAGHGFLVRVIRDYLIWEPLLNDAIVNWEMNALNEFDRSVALVRNVLSLEDEERDVFQASEGFPLRPQANVRLKVSDFQPSLRPLRNKSMFQLRLSQLKNRIRVPGSVSMELEKKLEVEVRIFLKMIQNNRFLTAEPPGFWESSRSGMPLIRSKPRSHRFLLDTSDFFKKALLFNNGTYTVAGGGMDMMYLQVRQLERYYKFHFPGSAIDARILLDNCQQGWEENKVDKFTEGLLKLAEHLRANDPQQNS